jgi:hypothetical protein
MVCPNTLATIEHLAKTEPTMKKLLANPEAWYTLKFPPGPEQNEEENGTPQMTSLKITILKIILETERKKQNYQKRTSIRCKVTAIALAARWSGRIRTVLEDKAAKKKKDEKKKQLEDKAAKKKKDEKK